MVMVLFFIFVVVVQTKVVDESLPKGAFRCPLVANIINPNIVRETTDATDCVKEGRYCSLYNDETKL